MRAGSTENEYERCQAGPRSRRPDVRSGMGFIVGGVALLLFVVHGIDALCNPTGPWIVNARISAGGTLALGFVLAAFWPIVRRDVLLIDETLPEN